MFPDTAYAEPRSSFGSPVPLPTVDPDAAPTLTISISCAWLPYIRGALSQLLLQSTWKTTNPADLLLAQQRASMLIAMLVECNAPITVSCPYDWSAGGSTADGFVVVPEPSYAPGFMGAFLSGTGWVETLMINSGSGLHIEGIEIDKGLGTAISVDAFQLNLQVAFGYRAGGIGGPGGIQAYHGASLVASATYNQNTHPDGLVSLVYAGPAVTVDKFHIDVRCGERNTFDPGGTVRLIDWGYNKVGGGC